MSTIIITELTHGSALGLPRGEFKLGAMVNAVYSSPFRDGLAILYVSQNNVKFSSNRLDESKIDDFSILKKSKYSFRLTFDEVIFHIEWQATEKNI